MRILLAVPALVFCFAACTSPTQPDQAAPAPDSVITSSFISPPIENVNAPFTEYTVDANKGDTLLYKTGSVLVFPPNAFVDKDGKVITGAVKVTYREFTDPLDIFLAGIPMQYDSAGRHYNFESFGMCQVEATQNGIPVFVNPSSSPEINMASRSAAPEPGLYYLDTMKKGWVYQGKAEVLVMSGEPKPTSEGPDKTGESVSLPMPVKPAVRQGNSPVLTVKIDPASFGELRPYDNLKFQVDETVNRFDPKDSEEEWNDIELRPGTKTGSYFLRFSNARRNVMYVVKPVLEGKDYDKSLAVYKRELRKYEAAAKGLRRRHATAKERYIRDSLQYAAVVRKDSIKYKLAREKFLRDSMVYVKTLQENERINKLNEWIEARNRYNRELRTVDSIARMNEVKAPSVFRRFSVVRFGIMNCDVTVSFEGTGNTFPLLASFQDKQGKPVTLTHVAVVLKGRNMLLRFPNNNIEFVKGAEHAIWGVVNNRFASVSFEEFSRTGITPAIKAYTFIVEIEPDERKSYEKMKPIFGWP